MRIKCPHSDIYLELPGDRTDMKFTCPACHKVHRVTITITTPGEEPAKPSANTRAVTRNQPQMPKKYATGAYAPVVDIPIDANFVLLDGSSIQEGIDLGVAAGSPPKFADDLSGRKTEIMDRGDSQKRVVPPAADKAAGAPAQNKDFLAASEDTAREEPPVDGRKLWDIPAEPAREEKRDSAWEQPAADPAAVPSSESKRKKAPEPALTGDNGDSVSKWDEEARRPGRKGGMAKSVFFVLLGALLLAGGFVGWQQYRFETGIREANVLLARADSQWGQGDIPAAAQSAREAEAALDRGQALVTFNDLFAWTGLLEPTEAIDNTAQTAIKQHLLREETLDAFKREVEPYNRSDLPGRFAEIRNQHDRPLARSMQEAIMRAAVRHIRLQSDKLTPEQAIDLANEERQAVSPNLGERQRAVFESGLADFSAQQLNRLAEEVREEVAAIADEADAGKSGALSRYRDLAARLRKRTDATLSQPIPEQAAPADFQTIDQLEQLNALIDEAYRAARSILSSHDDEDEDGGPFEAMMKRAGELNSPNPAMAEEASRLIDEARAEADDLYRIRAEVFGRMQSEMRRNRTYPGTRLAWSMLRTGFDDPEVLIDPSSFRFDTAKARMRFTFRGLPGEMDMGEDDYENRVAIRLGGYSFTTGWANLFHKPLVWMADLAESMRAAGIDPEVRPDWELLEGPGGPLALSLPRPAASESAMGSLAEPEPRQVFFNHALLPVNETPVPPEAAAVVADFLKAAERLHDGVMADDSIPHKLRQALKPVLMGTFQKPDPRDYFDSSFCRRLIEADYLEKFINPMPADRQKELDAYRQALGKLEAGYDEFNVVLPDGSRLYAVARMEVGLDEGVSSDQDPDSGETLPRLTWRVEKADSTVFYSPLPARSIFAFMLAAHYPGRVAIPPPGRPVLSEVWHPTKGLIASYRDGADKAEGDAELWNRAIAEDSSSRFDPTVGPPGWNFPLHVIELDDQGDPLTLATLSGVVKSPDFSGIADMATRREAEDAWLDRTAATLATPGELGLIFHQFFRYCSDSPLPELPNLIGSHYGLSDTHQTVYESLERRWVGRLIGDCDDLAEFFQVLTRRQGKLSHVMQLPGHAACGYVEKTDKDEYRFVLLQTGPVMQFTAPTLNQVVEIAYRAFDREGGMSHMTTDAVPILLRFANEETRTPFVLSARIYGDAEYAETMIKVQSYWHENVYSAAIEVMEGMVEKDPEIGSVKELGSLYERVGMYDKSLALRRRELEMVKDNPQASISTLLEVTQLHMQEKDEELALAALTDMETIMNGFIRRDDAPEFFKAMTFRSLWAMYLSRLGQPARAWNLVRYDVVMTRRQLGRVAEPVLRTLVVMYDRMCMARDSGAERTAAEERAMDEVRKELEEAFGRGYFKSDDSYNAIIGRYLLLGRYAVMNLGRGPGLERLLKDGPYPEGAKDHTKRSSAVTNEDWQWFRITPALYLAFGLEMLDRDEFPELYDPEGAKPLLEDVRRAVERGTGLGSDVAGEDDQIKSEVTLSFLNHDLEAFRRSLAVVLEKDYSSLYDDTALTFGLQCGMLPLEGFTDWIEAFHQYFPGTQHYFKVVYRAIDKENYDHALMMAEATVRFFPGNELLRREAEFVRSIIPVLKERKRERDMQRGAGLTVRPAA